MGKRKERMGAHEYGNENIKKKNNKEIRREDSSNVNKTNIQHNIFILLLTVYAFAAHTVQGEQTV